MSRLPAPAAGAAYPAFCTSGATGEPATGEGGRGGGSGEAGGSGSGGTWGWSGLTQVDAANGSYTMQFTPAVNATGTGTVEIDVADSEGGVGKRAGCDGQAHGRAGAVKPFTSPLAILPKRALSALVTTTTATAQLMRWQHRG